MFSGFGFGGGAAAASSALTGHVKWYYYLQRDPRGSPDGWYEYDTHINMTVEQLFQSSQTGAPFVSAGGRHKRRHVLSMVASSGYSYELDFQLMTQRNTVSGKIRPIFRTNNGLPPTAPPATARAAFVPAVPAAPPAPFGAAAPHIPVAHAFPVPVAASAPPAHLAAFSSGGGGRASRAAAVTNSQTLHYVAPKRLHEIKVDEAKVFVDVQPPATDTDTDDNNKKPKAKESDEEKKNGNESSYSKAAHDDDCVICLDSLWGGTERVVAIKNCDHRFHYQCIHEALTKAGGKCPLCSKSVCQEEDSDSRTSKGKCPSATMVVRTRVGMSCGGYPGADTLEISYRMPSGIQKNYHPQPGSSFSGANRTAYLPDNQEGQDLLSRMQFAFMHGLCFMVGTSLTTGQLNTVTWASIHHKTSMRGGTYGFPDATYFNRANDEMNNLSVPPPQACRTWLQNKCPGYDL